MRQFILLMTDSTRADMLECYNNTVTGRPTGLKTPNLDALAADGVRFDRAYSCQPVCGPARGAIFTGMFPHSNGVVSNCLAPQANVRHIGKRLADKGIATGYIGKWHLDGGDYFGLGQCSEGFEKEYWFDMKNYLEELTPEQRLYSRSRKAADEGVPAEFTFAHKITDRAIKFIEMHKDEDFFLVVSLDEPHDPSLCPREFAHMYDDYEFPVTENVRDTLENKPDYQKRWAGKCLNEDRSEIHIKAPRFFGCNSFADAELGRVIDCARKVTPHSALVYTSDHGDALMSHRLYAKGPTVYEEIARVPMIFSGEGWENGKVSSSPASHIDFAPTIMDYFGFKAPPVFEGKSMIPELKNIENNTNDVVFCEFTRYETDHDGFGGFRPMRAAIGNKLKLQLNLTEEDEMYDDENDPNELNNCINDDKYAEDRDKMHDEIIAWMDRTRDTYRGAQWMERPWRKDMPRQTWAVNGYTRQREDEDYEPRQLDYATGLPMENATRIK